MGSQETPIETWQSDSETEKGRQPKHGPAPSMSAFGALGAEPHWGPREPNPTGGPGSQWAAGIWSCPICKAPVFRGGCYSWHIWPAVCLRKVYSRSQRTSSPGCGQQQARLACVDMVRAEGRGQRGRHGADTRSTRSAKHGP